MRDDATIGAALVSEPSAPRAILRDWRMRLNREDAAELAALC